MTSEKKLQKIGIIPKEKLKIEEKNHIAKTIASKLSENIEALSDCYHELYMRIFNSDLYYADMDKKFCGIFYFYKTNTIYIDENKNVSNIDGYMIHEVKRIYTVILTSSEIMTTVLNCLFLAMV